MTPSDKTRKTVGESNAEHFNDGVRKLSELLIKVATEDGYRNIGIRFPVHGKKLAAPVIVIEKT